jgi:hypothetical protein
MIKQFLIIYFVCISISTFSQTFSKDFSKLVKEAELLYKKKEYLKAGNLYSEAFSISNNLGSTMIRIDAACSWALAGKIDSAFNNLNNINPIPKYSEYSRIINDTNLSTLYKEARWNNLVKKLKNSMDESNKSYNRQLLYLLDSLVFYDIKWRNYEIEYNNNQLYNDTISLETIKKNIQLTDSLNYLQIKKIFLMFGYPNYDLVGEEGSLNFWFLVQHQDQYPDFQERVLQKMEVEANLKKASSVNYAYLVDRVKVNTNKKQVYGTQCKLNKNQTSMILKPVIRPRNLNKRRKSVGLGSIENYIATMNEINKGKLRK